LYIEAIHHDSTGIAPYLSLAIARSETQQSLTLRDGRTMTKQQLCVDVEAIHHNDLCATAFFFLAVLVLETADLEDSITLRDGRTMTQQQLLVRALHLDGTCAYVYNLLARTLPAGLTVALRDGRVMTAEDLLAASAAL
jgi:hypothetical protein